MIATGSLEISNIPSGQPSFFMTFGMHYCGIFQGVRDGSVLLSDVRLIGNIGPMIPFTKGLSINGVKEHASEPIYEDEELVGNVPLDVVQFFGALAALPKRTP